VRGGGEEHNPRGVPGKDAPEPAFCATPPHPKCGFESTKHRDLGFRARLAHEAAEIEMALM